MIDYLEKLEEFADWACWEHLGNAGQCLKACYRVRNNTRVCKVILKQHEFEMTQYKRWKKYRAWFQRLQYLQIKYSTWDMADADRCLLTSVARGALHEKNN